DLPRGVRLAFQLELIDLAAFAQLVRQLADRWPFLSFRLAAEPPLCLLDVEGQEGAGDVARAVFRELGACKTRAGRARLPQARRRRTCVAPMSPFALSLLATLWVSALALIGIAFLFVRRPEGRGEAFLLSFAAGVLLATTFLDLLPEAIERGQGDGNIFLATL